MYKIILLAILSCFSFQSYALKVDKIFFLADQHGNGSITLTNDEDQILFIMHKVDEINVNNQNNVIKNPYDESNITNWKISINPPKLILRPRESKTLRIRNLCPRSGCDTSKDLVFMLSFYGLSQEGLQTNYVLAPVYVIPTKTPKFNYQFEYKNKKFVVKNRSNTMISVTLNACEGKVTSSCLFDYIVVANRTKTYDLPDHITKKNVTVYVRSHNSAHKEELTIPRS